jgi:hypothetical protein
MQAPMSMHGRLFAISLTWSNNFFCADLWPMPAILTTRNASFAYAVIDLSGCHQQQSQDHR